MVKKKLILIARVSDEEQLKALPAQKRRLKQYAEKMRQTYEYYEFNESAFGQDRRKFSKIVEHIEQQTEPCIVVFDKADRFSRKYQEDVVRLERLVKLGRIELHFPSDNLYIDKESPAPDLFRLDIATALAEYYSNAISDNVKRRFDQMLEDGIWVHRAPIGYKNTLITNGNRPIKDIEADSERAHYIVKAFEMRVLGKPYAVIAKELSDDGLTTSRGNKPTKQLIERTLRNPFYYGVMMHNGKKHPHKYEPLISRALFNQVQQVGEDRRHEKTKYDSKNYTFKKVVRCGKCGRMVSSFRARNTVYLRCANPDCNNPNTAESLVIGGVIDDIKLIEIPESWMDKIIHELKERHDDQQLYFSHSISKARHDYDIVLERRERIYYDLLDGRITQDFHDKIAIELENRQHELENQLKSLTNNDEGFQITSSYLLDLTKRAYQLFSESDNKLKQKLLEFLLSNVELNDKKLSYTLNDPFRAIVEAKKKSPSAPKSNIWCGLWTNVYTN